MRARVLIAVGALVLVGAGVLSWHLLASRTTPAGQEPLTQLSQESYAELQDAFNAANDEIRVVVLLSPT